MSFELRLLMLLSAASVVATLAGLFSYVVAPLI